MTFVSLFLWFVVGVQTVEVAVDSHVDRVAILLDGTPAATLDHEPWTAEIDFGPLLSPHELTAIAFDAAGEEIARARQVVNLPRPPVMAKLVVDHDDTGRPTTARVITASVARNKPASIVTSLDGQVLAPDGEGHFPLPALEPGTSHLLSTEANWADGSSAGADLSLGGSFGEIVASELTAVPIRVTGSAPTVAGLDGRLTVDDSPLRVVAVERSGARIYVIRDLGAGPTLKALGKSYLRPPRSVRARYDPIFEPDLAPEIDRSYLVGVNAVDARGISLFPVAGPVSLKRWTLPWAVTNLYDRYTVPTEQRLADAVAVAGVRAAGHGSPRAVVLVVAEDAVDVSGYSAAAVRHYLSELGVPLFVWVMGKDTDTAWGRGARTSSPREFTRATERLFDELGHQWIVWVEGLHLVNRINLDGTDLGITPVGADTAVVADHASNDAHGGTPG